MNKEISIVIVDDHPIFRHGLRTLIEADPMLKVIGEASDSKSALATVHKFQPDVVVLDIEMPVATGLAFVSQLRQEQLPVEPIFLTMYEDETLLSAAVELGVKGFILKDDATNEIITCIKAIAAGESYFSPTLMGDFIARRNNVNKPAVKELTPRERRVLSLVAQTMSNKQIADAMAISVRTVEHHRSNICAKLQLSGKNSLLAFALLHKSEFK